MKRMRSSVCAAAVCLLSTGQAAAQDAPALERLRVYIDCSYYCDMDHIRTELNWVEYMRDRADSDVHVLVIRQATGGGGGEYTLEFIGLRAFTGRADTLKYVSPADATSDIIRNGLVRVIKLGLVPYVASTPLGLQLNITHNVPTTSSGAPTAPSTTQRRDPWNYWSFTVGLNGNSSGESQAFFGSYSGSLTANRTTDAWKINLRGNGSYNEQTFSYVLDSVNVETKSIRRSYSANALIVKSWGPHMSIGGRLTASSSTVGNTSLSFSIAPAVEYNLLPYSESTRRSLTVQYSAGARYADYREMTIFDQFEETRPVHTLALAYSTRQQWGSINFSVNGSQFLHDGKKYNAGIYGGTSLRLFRGFSFNIDGGYTRVRDQLSLAKRDLTEEEILLRQRQLATAYNYYAYFGVSYRFGSIFNTVVNPRFGGSGGGEIIFF